MEKEASRSINFLDITIHRAENNFSIDIYRKPTYTDSIIPNDSCHPTEHKYAAIRYLYNRMNSYQLPPDKKDEEKKVIQEILHRNGYDASTLKSISGKKRHEKGTKKHTDLNSHTSVRRPDPSRNLSGILG